MLNFEGTWQTQHSMSSQTQRALPLRLPTFTSESLGRLRLIPKQPPTCEVHNNAGRPNVLTAGLAGRLRNITLIPEEAHCLLKLASAFANDVVSGTLPPCGTVNKITGWVRDLGTPSLASDVTASVALHALGYQAHVLVLCDAFCLTGAWTSSVDEPLGVDLAELFLRSTSFDHNFLRSALKTRRIYKPVEPPAKHVFDWKTPLVSRFLRHWYMAGCPVFDAGELKARATLAIMIHHIGAENPQLLCHCGAHLLATEAEHRNHLQLFSTNTSI
ncbi:hypothetical protein C8R47DRAFT_1215220 [Mycena vitilis]|nr:hypothetical protein C8R47DRAFT_1215220 [Mycena vitilis]